MIPAIRVLLAVIAAGVVYLVYSTVFHFWVSNNAFAGILGIASGMAFLYGVDEAMKHGLSPNASFEEGSE